MKKLSILLAAAVLMSSGLSGMQDLADDQVLLKQNTNGDWIMDEKSVEEARQVAEDQDAFEARQELLNRIESGSIYWSREAKTLTVDNNVATLVDGVWHDKNNPEFIFSAETVAKLEALVFNIESLPMEERQAAEFSAAITQYEKQLEQQRMLNEQLAQQDETVAKEFETTDEQQDALLKLMNTENEKLEAAQQAISRKRSTADREAVNVAQPTPKRRRVAEILDQTFKTVNDHKAVTISGTAGLATGTASMASSNLLFATGCGASCTAGIAVPAVATVVVISGITYVTIKGVVYLWNKATNTLTKYIIFPM